MISPMMTTTSDFYVDEGVTDDDNTAALKLAMEEAMADPLRKQQLLSMLQNEPWEKVAQFAAYCCQGQNLKLKPWQRPPCHCYLDEEATALACNKKAYRLLRRMLNAGISRWHPNPLAALAET